MELGYWPIKARAEPIRWLLQYLALEYSEYSPTDMEAWKEKKVALSQKNNFINLPYLQSGDKVYSESMAVAKMVTVLGDMPELFGEGDSDRVQVAQLLGVLTDLENELYKFYRMSEEDLREKAQGMLDTLILPRLTLLNQFLGDKIYFMHYLTYADFLFVFLQEYIAQLCHKIELKNPVDDFFYLVRQNKELRMRPGLKEYLLTEEYLTRPIMFPEYSFLAQPDPEPEVVEEELEVAQGEGEEEGTTEQNEGEEQDKANEEGSLVKTENDPTTPGVKEQTDVDSLAQEVKDGENTEKSEGQLDSNLNGTEVQLTTTITPGNPEDPTPEIEKTDDITKAGLEVTEDNTKPQIDAIEQPVEDQITSKTTEYKEDTASPKETQDVDPKTQLEDKIEEVELKVEDIKEAVKEEIGDMIENLHEKLEGITEKVEEVQEIVEQKQEDLIKEAEDKTEPSKDQDKKHQE